MNLPTLFFSGSSHSKLAQEVCLELGITLGSMTIGSFPDGEISIEILEEVRGRDVFVLQSLSIDPNHFLMELLIISDALKRSCAKSITAIIPYFGYCRQDRKNKQGVPITAKLVANLLSSAGISHLITFDLHSDQVEGFFEIPVTHLRTQELLSDQIKGILGKNIVVVAPDIGSVKIAEKTAKLLQAELAIVKKERLNAFDVNMHLIGNVAHKNVLIVDDLCSTGGTLIAASKLCQKLGAQTIIASISHGLFVGNSIENIESSPLELLLTTNTIPLRDQTFYSPKIAHVSIDKLIAAAINKFLF